VIKIINTYFI